METRTRRSKVFSLFPAALAALLLISPAMASAQAVSGLYESCLLRGRPVHDFKLKDVVSGRMVTFLEAARREYTFLYYLDARSEESLDNLRALERLRDSHPDRIGLVGIFLAPSGVGFGTTLTEGLVKEYEVRA